MFSLKNPRVERLFETVIWSFVWMIVALAWNSFIDSILIPLRNKFSFLGVIGYFLYALMMTWFAITIISFYVHFIGKINDEKNKD